MGCGGFHGKRSQEILSEEFFWQKPTGITVENCLALMDKLSIGTAKKHLECRDLVI